MSKAIAIIPARWGSTRFPGKPLYNLAGKPLLQHVWERCLQAQALDEVIIATDDERIAQVARACGAEVRLTSKQHGSGTDRITEVARAIPDAECIVNVQGDEPLVEPQLINRIVRKLRSDPSVDIVTAAHPFTRRGDISSPHQVKVAVSARGRALDFSRQAIAPNKSSTKILRHQGIYGFKRAALLRFASLPQSIRERTESLEQLRALENGVTVHVLVTKHGSPGVDTPQDARRIATLLRQRSANGDSGSTQRRSGR